MAEADAAPRPLWLDCDPGHDDAMAILLAGHHPGLNLLGISTNGTNQSVENTTENALRITEFYKVPVPVVSGAPKPLLRPAKHCQEIHGDSGLDGTDGNHSLPPCSAGFMARWNAEQKGRKAVPEMYRLIREHYEATGGQQRVTIVATGSLTNVALAIAVYGDDLREALDGIVFMGGSVRAGGNTGIVAEFNIQTDPEAAQLVIDSNIPVTMVPLDLTHTVLVTDDVIDRIRRVSFDHDTSSIQYGSTPHGSTPHGSTPPPDRLQSVITRTIDLLTFFATTYKSVFGFSAPPLHDPVAIAFLADPSIFTATNLFVSIETHNPLSAGQTIVDLHAVTPHPPNVLVAHTVDVDAFWNLLLDALRASL